MIDWLDVSIHAGIAAVVVGIACLFPGYCIYAAVVVSAGFWIREALQHMDREGIDGSFGKALLPWKWGLGSQMELLAPVTASAVVASLGYVYG